MSDILIYGAYGYSGRLIAEAAVARGMRPVLAGRDATRTAALAHELGLPFRSFALEQPSQVDQGLQGIAVVLHCAGPFSATAAPMLDGCLRARAHYLDICGEYQVIEAVAARDAALREAGIMAMCGVGMDVVPTDCLAAHMRRRMPDAVRLDIYIRALEQLSPGTATTMIEGMGLPNVVRAGGQLVERTAGADRRKVPFPDRTVSMVSVPWGDIATAWRTTGIADIAVHMSLLPGAPIMVALSRYGRSLQQSALVQRALKALVRRFVTGPGAGQREAAHCEFIAEARDAQGKLCRSYLATREGYALTVDSACAIAARVLAGQARPGFQTPGGLFGADFVLELPGSERRDLV